MLEGANLLITGGAGFIGSALCRRLAPNNKVRVFDNLRRDALSETGLLDHPNVSLVEGDVRDLDALREAAKGVDHVLHLASIAGVDTVLKHPVLTMDVAMTGTMNALRVARDEGGVKRFVDFSTSEVFGTFAFRASEEDPTQLGAVGEARWTYAVAKLATEHLCYNYFKEHGLPTVCIRPFNVYGPGQVGEGAIHAFIVRALKGEPIRIHNEGDQIRAWCYIDDIVDGILRVLTRDEAVGESFNLGNARSTLTIYRLARLIQRLVGNETPIEFVEWDFPDVQIRVPSVDKAERLLEFRAGVDLEEGLERTIDWYRARL